MGDSTRMRLRTDSEVDVIREVQELRRLFLRDAQAGRTEPATTTGPNMTPDARGLGRIMYMSSYPAYDEDPETSATYGMSFYGEDYYR